MTETEQTESKERMETRQLSLEQMDQASGGETFNDAVQSIYILIQFYLHGRTAIAKGPLT